MRTRNVNLTNHFDRFVEAGVASGRSGNFSEAVREGLRLLEQREKEDKARIEWLRSAVKEDIDDLERDEYYTLKSRQEIRGFVRKASQQAARQH